MMEVDEADTSTGCTPTTIHPLSVLPALISPPSAVSCVAAAERPSMPIDDPRRYSSTFQTLSKKRNTSFRDHSTPLKLTQAEAHVQDLQKDVCRKGNKQGMAGRHSSALGSES